MLNIRSLTLSHVAGVEYAHLEFPDNGVLVVHGPNEVGKSTLLRAIRLLLDDTPTSSRKREVKALKDVGVDEPTTISAQMVVGDMELHLTKAYNKGTGRCELQVSSPRAESLTGREASDRFAEILRGEVDTDLLDALTVEQGASLDQLAAAGLGPLERALAEDTGVQVTAAGEQGDIGAASTLVERIAAERSRYFTPSGRASKELKAADDELAVALEEHGTAEHAYDQAQKLITELERLRTEKDEIARQEPTARAEAQSTAADLEKGRERQRRIDEHSLAVTRANQELDLAEQRLQVREDRVTELTEATTVRDAAAEAVTAATEAADGERQRETELRESLAEHRRRARTLSAYGRYLSASERREEVAKTRQALAEQQEKAEDVSRKIEETRKNLADNPVTPELESTVRQAEAERRRALGIRDASATLVEVSGPVGTQFRVDGSDRELAEVPESLRVTSPRELEFGDVTVNVTPARGKDGSVDAGDLDADVERAEAALRAALAEAGVTNLEDVADRAEARRVLQESLGELRITLSQATGGLSLEELRQKTEENDRDYRTADAAVSTAHDLISEEDPDGVVTLPEGSATDAILRQVDEAEAQAEKTREDLDTLARTGAVAVLTSRVEERDRAEARVTTIGSALEKMRAEVGDDHLREQVTLAHQGVDTAQGELDALLAETDHSAGDLDTLEGLAEGAQSRVTKLRDRADRIGHEISGANGALGEHSGVAERLEVATSRLERARRTQDRVNRQAQAADALHQAVQAARDDARRRYEAPYRASVEKLARTLYGRAVTIEFDEDLRISRRVLDSTALDAAQLSGGAREQLSILSRLAVADIVGKGEGVPVVIDDALGFADSARVQRMNVVLSQLGRTNQIIVLTCDPARFDSVPGATVTSMAELQG
ncbi:AAA family ATPase [Corynebacterium sp. AOP40-9SA-29]|uniref:AAA family ATPase n=1 Tax=Corynebacterium sp. AOP40-9SA-29 TaxID=3457677 RepID=UPI0040338E24